MLDLLTNRLRTVGISNVVPVLGTITDPRLPANGVDSIVMVDVYHEFDHPYEMTAAMCRALKPGGRMIFVEFRGEDATVPIKRVHKMTEAQVKKEMSVHPLVWKEYDWHACHGSMSSYSRANDRAVEARSTADCPEPLGPRAERFDVGRGTVAQPAIELRLILQLLSAQARHHDVTAFHFRQRASCRPTVSRIARPGRCLPGHGPNVFSRPSA